MLTGVDAARDEAQLVDFVSYEGWFCGNKASTVRSKLSGIRWHHLHAGLPNPLEGKFLLNSAIKSLKKLRGDSTGKLPVTPQLLSGIDGSLSRRRLVTRLDDEESRRRRVLIVIERERRG